MNAKTTAERVQALRSRRDAMGLTRVEVYAHPDDVEAVKKYAAKKRKARMKSGDMTADDIYATFARGKAE